MADISQLNREQLLERQSLLMRKKELMSKKGQGSSSPFNVGEIIKPFMPGSPTAMMPGVQGLQAASTAYEQAKEPAIQGIKNPVGKFAASTGIDMASGMAAEGLAGAIGKGLAKRGVGMVANAESMVPRLLPPEKGVIENQHLYGGEKSYQKNLAPFIKKSKDFEELGGKLRGSEEELVSQRQGIYDANPQIPDQQMMQPAIGTLEKASELGVVPGSKLEQMKKLITEQVDFLNNLPKEKRLSTQFTQDRKQAFQKMAEDIYGEATAPDEKIAQQMYRDFAKSNQMALEGLSPEIGPLNQKIAALIGGKKSAALLGEKASVGQLPSLLERIVQKTPFINNFFAVNEGKRLALEALKSQRNVPNMSGKIQGLMDTAGLYKEMGEPGPIQTTLKDLAKRRKK